MSDEKSKVVPFKLAEREKEKTLAETLEKIIKDWKESDEHVYDNISIGALVVDAEDGIRIIPLVSNKTVYEFVGFMEAAKTIMVDSMYSGDGDDESY